MTVTEHTILVPVDASEDRARRQADFVVGLPGGTDDLRVYLTHTFTGDETEVANELQRLDRVEAVKLVRDRLDDHGIDVELTESRSPPGEGILALVDELDIDHVVVGSSKGSPTGKMVFGSVAQTVVLHSDIPVTVVGAPD